MKHITSIHTPNRFVVDWNIGKRCNYDCAYCPTTIHDNHSPHRNFSELNKAASFLIDYCKKIKRDIKFTFTGGEPTVNPDFSDFLFSLKEKGVDSVTVTTNGTRKPDWYMFHKDCIRSLTVSLHYEKDWNKTLHTILQIHKAFRLFTVNVMVHHDFYDEVVHTTQMLLKNNINFRLKRIRWSEQDLYLNDDYDDSSMYDERFIKLFESLPDSTEDNILIDGLPGNTNNVVKFRQNNFFGWKCFAGIEGICIDPEGEVYRGTCKQGGSIGNIFSNQFFIDNNPITCYKQYCSCVSDVLFTKYKEGENNER